MESSGNVKIIHDTDGQCLVSLFDIADCLGCKVSFLAQYIPDDTDEQENIICTTDGHMGLQKGCTICTTDGQIFIYEKELKKIFSHPDVVNHFTTSGKLDAAIKGLLDE